MFNVYRNQLSRQTGSRNLMGSKTLPTIWGTYIKLVTKYQISAINSCWEKCAYMFNVTKNQQSRQTGSRNLMDPKTLPTIWGTYMNMTLVTKYQISVISSCWEKCDEKCAYMFNVYKDQLSRQTGSRNLTGPKTLPTPWYTYMMLVTKYQISAINSYWEKCDEKYLGRTDRGKTVYPPHPSGSRGIIKTCTVVINFSVQLSTKQYLWNIVESGIIRFNTHQPYIDNPRLMTLRYSPFITCGVTDSEILVVSCRNYSGVILKHCLRF
jgi:hypothetical protein